ncbi:chorion class B protein M2410-like [Maniola hyperantus]|uniref:chorion class B protein M2410-like n=1 Tax=Aphantopus hyperantus TaxID=2795564 RepID=UPI001567E8F9|nr:chorion class B protein M2410-like [Maniola hyperantus]
MVFKAVLFVCAQALVMQSISGQCIGAGWAGAPWGGIGAPWGGIGAPCGCGAEWVATPAFSGGGLPVASASAIPPNGVSVLSENAYAGELAVRGALPFLGTVGLEGVVPTAGAGAVAYGCGNGEVAMLTEGAAGIAGPLGYGAGIGPFGYGYDGLGCGAAIGPFGYGYDGLARGGCGYGLAFI